MEDTNEKLGALQPLLDAYKEKLSGVEVTSSRHFHFRGLCGSAKAVAMAALFRTNPNTYLCILPDQEEAAYFFNDLQVLLGDPIDETPEEREKNAALHKVLFFPTSYRRVYEADTTDNANALQRTNVLSRLGNSPQMPMLLVSYPEALAEKVVVKTYVNDHSLTLHTGDLYSIDDLLQYLFEHNFESQEFVYEPGQFSIRGGIVDVFGFGNLNPYRIEYFDEGITSLRTFNTGTQLTIETLNEITILPNLQDREIAEQHIALTEYLSSACICIDNPHLTAEKIGKEYNKVLEAYKRLPDSPIRHLSPQELFDDGTNFVQQLDTRAVVEIGNAAQLRTDEVLAFETLPQTPFGKNMERFVEELEENNHKQYINVILSDNEKQLDRIATMIEETQHESCPFFLLRLQLHEGFTDKQFKLAVYTDHQLFERYHRYRLNRVTKDEQITLHEIYDLQPGDYITHIDHGVGIYRGLEIIDVGGKQQEAIRLEYKNKDTVYISIHALHRISKYVGKDGTPPTLHRLGSGVWEKLKNKTKERVKTLAIDLIKLYAQRKTTEGFAFAPDSYLQTELEASFLYEDTPDQHKAAEDVKRDMETNHPMDRLVCGDVGFGKTEVAVRAAFKAVCDSKQVAVLVPTTILAWQHYNTFSERLHNLPAKVEYLNRFKSAKQQRETIQQLKEGKIDIIIGTHRLLSKDIQFKDLGLLIIDEEQKFGVGSKEKLREMRVNIDTLTLSATPIPRTLQFSLMGARDLSVISTPPANRQPIQTELHVFDENVIRDAIAFEMSRNGQTFVVHNRVANITEIAGIISKLVPDARVAVGHGKMKGEELEQLMLDFMNGLFDVLVCTTIVESGLDIPNANTIIITDAQNYGLSDLHQLRGRVGRSNRRAFCYLLVPSFLTLTEVARKRLKAIEDFSDIGSGFNIAMRDLDIRGAGDILGAEQSGFISDLGFDMYQKILAEAINELKDATFEAWNAEQTDENKKIITTSWVNECLLETDLEILIPNEYVSSINERLSLYKQLDMASSDDDLLRFRTALTDRFGSIPPQTEELINAVRLRWLAKQLNFEKVVLKGGKCTCYCIANRESPYYNSEAFTQLLTFVQEAYKTNTATLKEQNNKLMLTFRNISTVGSAIEALKKVPQ